MTDYTRYDNSISYGNGLTYRLDYTDIQVAVSYTHLISQKGAPCITYLIQM